MSSKCDETKHEKNAQSSEEAKRHQKRENRETEKTKNIGERLREHVELIEVAVLLGVGQHAKKTVVNTKQKTNKTKFIACRRSSLLKPVALKETVMVTAHTPGGTPKPLTIQTFKQGPELEGPSDKQRQLSPSHPKLFPEQNLNQTRKLSNYLLQFMWEKFIWRFGVAGPMGRPEFLGSRVGDRNTERAEAYPVPGTAPSTLAPDKDRNRSETPETRTWSSS